MSTTARAHPRGHGVSHPSPRRGRTYSDRSSYVRPWARFRTMKLTASPPREHLQDPRRSAPAPRRIWLRAGTRWAWRRGAGGRDAPGERPSASWVRSKSNGRARGGQRRASGRLSGLAGKARNSVASEIEGRGIRPPRPGWPRPSGKCPFAISGTAAGSLPGVGATRGNFIASIPGHDGSASCSPL